MQCPPQQSPPGFGLLSVLEYYVRGQLKPKSFLCLMVGLVFCTVLFVGRSQILKKVPDKHFPCISHDQLVDFFKDPQRPEDTSTQYQQQAATDSLNAVSSQNPMVPLTSTRRCRLLIFYATTEATVDFAFPLVYGTLCGVLLWLIFGPERRWPLIFPLAIVIADLAENATMIWLALSLANVSTNALGGDVYSVPNWATVPTAVKWGLGVATLLVASYGVVVRLAGGFARRF